MAGTRRFTAIIYAEDDGFVALCPELDIASQGDSIEEARINLKKALQLFFEVASSEEVASSFHGDSYVTQVDIAVA